MYFIYLKFNPQYWYLLLRREKMCWFSSYFKQSQNLCLNKIFNIVSTTKVNCRDFYFFILDAHNSSIAKKLFISHLSNRSDFAFVCFFSKKTFSPQKMFVSCLCLCHGTYLNSTSNVFSYLLVIFLGHDRFGFFLNKWVCITSTP